uniref:Uncharacterized protein n=1 Tax=Tanacetum cinerariifolium TaxID=118510 RepID=A0A699H259_TANCI|nr:hypothetical protein [Tanacetum cinerariifolium]
MNDDFFTYEMRIPGISYSLHGEQQCDDPEYCDDLDIYEPQACYDENEGIYVEAVIFVNNRLVRLMDVTIEQWLDLMYGDHRIVDRKIKEEVIYKWLIRSYKKQFNEYMEIKKHWMTYGIDADIKYDPSNMYWIRGDDEEVLIGEELSDLEETYVNEKDEIVEIFRIETDIFDFKTPLCKAFNEFNYLLKVDAYLLTHDIPGFKTYKEYKSAWIYE